ncbi:HARLDQ motif MBL-fold protein [Proteus hauseri]|uniref:HARLDQ motif MBL-fold protein n=1 Tax=Proteus hauseri TaxID=183417 RepID=UPI0032DA3B14
MKKLTLLALGMIFTPITMAALNPAQPLSEVPPISIFQEWAKPIAPFKIAPQVWYVGTKNLTSILLTTEDGHILIDAGLNESALQIKENIENIGFDVKDIKYILNSHARLDQAGGIALLKELSGAKVVSNKINAQQLKLGGAEDFALGDALLFPSVNTDIELLDNESFILGNIIVTALFTPGHLPGSTSWKVTFKNDDVLIYADSLATPDYFLKNNLNYPKIVEDLKYSQNILANQKVDIFIASKGDRFNLEDKLNKLNNGDKNAFYDSEGLKEYVEKSKSSLMKQLNQSL